MDRRCWRAGGADVGAMTMCSSGCFFWICIHYIRPGKELEDIGDFKDWNYESTEKLADLKKAWYLNNVST